MVSHSPKGSLVKGLVHLTNRLKTDPLYRFASEMMTKQNSTNFSLKDHLFNSQKVQFLAKQFSQLCLALTRPDSHAR